ncbi:hypothetical protein REH65_25040 [Saccharopolyspora sp. ID03-671]|uniref:hypothetical protein n=1 Tax=Saccharopolyspora sp. ID03-671 TaxID=3073066 RepID=UPI00324824DD
MSEGFRVDLHALEEASKGVSDTVQAARKDRVADLDTGVEFGHERLAGTVTDFCDRWDLGVAHLVTDGSEVGGRLVHCVQVYRQTDEAARAQLEGLITRPAGNDPAAG